MSAPTHSRGDFWSRRKAAVEAEQAAEQDARTAALRAEEEAKLEERTDAELLAELDLPEPEAMESSEQVQTLLKSAVPQRLKTRAMRRLWRLNPVLANVDGLVDYGEDFTDAANVVENLQTAYQVGKGMLKSLDWESPKPAAPEEIDEAEEALAAADTDAAETQQSHSAPDAPETAPETAPANAAEPGPPATDATAEARAPAAGTAPEPEAFAAAPRRMRFRFDTAT